MIDNQDPDPRYWTREKQERENIDPKTGKKRPNAETKAPTGSDLAA